MTEANRLHAASDGLDLEPPTGSGAPSAQRRRADEGARAGSEHESGLAAVLRGSSVVVYFDQESSVGRRAARVGQTTAHATVSAVAAALAVCVLISACAPAGSAPPGSPLATSASAETCAGCLYIPPRTLPSGTEPGDSREGTIAGHDAAFWGLGRDQVAEVIGVVDAPLPSDLPPDSPYRAEIRGNPAAITFVGDPGVGEVMVTWIAQDCAYAIWLPAGMDLREAAAYAREF